MKDVDSQISVTGLVITLTTRDGRIEVSKEPNDYTTNIDFSKVGVYEVTYKLDNNVSVSFPVQVVSKDWMKQYITSDI